MNYQMDDKTKSEIDRAASEAELFDQTPNQGPKSAGTGQRARKGSTVKRVVNTIFKLLLPLLVIGAGSYASWSLVSSKPEVNRRPAREQTYAVQVAMAKPADHQPDIVLYGTVSAARQVELRALVSGEVIWVSPNLVEGRTINEGEAIARIDPFDYEGGVREAEANFAEAKARLAETTASFSSDEAALERLIEQESFARNDLERAEKLVASGSLTRQALENRKLTLSQRQQSVEARQNNLTVLKARIEQQNANIERLSWRLEQARRNLADTTLKAPFTGLVQSKNVDLGRSVSGNDTLVSLYDPDQMDVRFTLSDTQYGRLISEGNELVGREISVNWKLGDVVQSHKATIERITPEVNASNGGIEVFARIAAGSDLRSGTFVELVVPDKIYKDAVEVPQAALYSGDVLYVNDNGRMQPRSIDILAYLGESVLVDGSIFPQGTEIITTRVAEAGPGLKLAIPGRDGGDTGAGRPRGEGNSPNAGQGARGQRGEGAQGERRPRPDGQRPRGERGQGRPQGERPATQGSQGSQGSQGASQ